MISLNNIKYSLSIKQDLNKKKWKQMVKKRVFERNIC